MQKAYTHNDFIPEDAYRFFPKSSETKNSFGARLIFDGNTQFDEYELKMCAQFKVYCQKNNYTLTPIWTDSLIIRFLQANAFKMDKTLVTVKEHTTWREASLPPKLTNDIQKFLDSGIFYVHGRDSKFRPIVIFRAYLIDVKTFDVDLMINALTYFFEFAIANLFLPGQVENWNFIVDLNGMGLTSIPMGPMKKLISFLQHNYRGRLYTMYIVNVPSSIYLPWQFAKKFMEESTTKKIQFVKKQNPENLFTYTRPDQVEERYGGTCKNLTTFWPPYSPPGEIMLNEQEKIVLVSKEEYVAMYNSKKLTNLKVCEKLVQQNVEVKPNTDIKQEKISIMIRHATDLKGISPEKTRDNTPEKRMPEEVNSEGEGDDEARIRAQRLNNVKLLSVKMCSYSELNIEEGDYLDSMDEHYNCSLMPLVVREFRAIIAKRK